MGFMVGVTVGSKAGVAVGSKAGVAVGSKAGVAVGCGVKSGEGIAFASIVFTCSRGCSCGVRFPVAGFPRPEAPPLPQPPPLAQGL